MIKNPFRYFKTSREIIQIAVMMYIRFPLSLRNVEDLLHERGIDVCHESIRLWVDRFGTFFARMIRKRRSCAMRQVTQWRWHLDEVDPSDDAGDGGGISNWGETGKPAHRPKEPHPRRTPTYLMATTPTTCMARKIATAAMEMWITRCASYRTFPQRNNSNLLVISVVDPNRPSLLF